MLNLRNFTIRLRLYVLGAFAITAMLAIGGAALFSLAEVRHAFGHYVENDVQSLVEVANIRAGVGNLRRYEKDLLINFSEPKDVEKYHTEWVKVYDGIGKSIKRLDGLAVPPEIREAVGHVGRDLQSYRAGLETVYQRIGKGEFPDTAAANKAMEPVKGAIRGVDSQLAKLTELIDKDSDEGAVSIAARERVIQWALIAVISVGVIVVGSYTVFNIRSILRPLQTTVATSERIADHDLSQTIDVEGHDETAAVLQGVKGMQVALREVVGGVRTSTESIATASREVAMGSQDLSNRTEQAASRLQETASAMEELTASVKHNSESARQANQLALDAAKVAHRGGSVVGEVVDTMNTISESSRKIGDIIAVIDGIAFQTNILALNAAVEAARAGEQGRGFAVVAGEVRTLAQRSAEAAKEIKTLITASADSVGTGSRLVAHAGETMQEIVGSVERVSQIVSEISNATLEQSAGIAQIGDAISNLDQMTQQNAALVEQSAAAAQSLQQQADDLSHSVSVFKLA